LAWRLPIALLKCAINYSVNKKLFNYVRCGSLNDFNVMCYRY